MLPNSKFQNKKTQLFLVLSGIFISNALLAELIGVKIFSGESALGVAPAQLRFLGDMVLDFNLTAGVVIWPVVFITSDIINEYFGKSGVKKVSWLTVSLIVYAFLIIGIVTALPPANFWLEVNAKDPSGNPFDMNFAFNSVFRQGLGIMIGSVTAFLLAQLLDATIFQWLKSRTGTRKIWLRATGSTIVSQLMDSFVVLFIAFYLFGNWTFEMVLSVSLINYLYKFSVAVLLTPVLYLAHYFIDLYLGKEVAHQLEAEAVSDPLAHPTD